MRFNLRTLFASLASVGLLASLSACGGGGSDGPYISPAEGFYVGNLTNTGHTVMQMIVLENDSFWAVYGTPAVGGFDINGFVQGQGSAMDGSFISNNMRDFNQLGTAAATLTGTYGGETIGGTWDYANITLGFSGYQPAVSSYNYFQPASLLSIAGPWNVTDFLHRPTSFNISGNGTVVSTAGACVYSGSVAPRASGINVFDLSITLTGGTCDLPLGSTLHGVAVSNPVSAGHQQIIIAATDESRAYGLAANGLR